MARPVYLLTVYYANAKKQATDLAKIPIVARKVSNGDYKVIQYDDHIAGYFFTSDLDSEALRDAFREVLAEKLQVMIVRIHSLVGSSIPTQNALWLEMRGVEIRK